MTYLLNEILLYLIIAAALGALVGWLMRRCGCSRDLADMQVKIDRIQRELDDKTAKFNSYKNEMADLRSQFDLQSGELKLMTSRWHSTLSKAKQLPKYQYWLEKVQCMNQQTRRERDKFADLTSHYAALHADANQKIELLNKRITAQEEYKNRLDDMEEQKNIAKRRLTQIEKKYTERFHEQQVQHRAEIEEMKNRIDELTPLEGNSVGQDTTFNRFMDKIRLVGTTKNTVLGRTYKQIEETKLEASENERVFVDTCEEKDAIIEDLRELVHTAENRAQATVSASLQENVTRIRELETELKSLNETITMLRNHEHTVDNFKNKLLRKPTPHIQKVKPIKPANAHQPGVKKSSPKPASGLKAPTKGLNITAAKVKDDLKLIKGIGPVMEKKLNNFGVYSFEQLGTLTSKDIDVLAETLESFPGRIKRDKWVNQSKQQFKKKYNNSLD